MPNPIVIAHHLIWTGYGWWLPNDPRGSTSHYIASDVIAELGKLHFGYIEENPVKWRLPRQQWPLVIEYDGWPLHPGHNPNSPYARGLRDYRG